MENNFTFYKVRLRAKQAAEYLGVSASLLEKMRFRGEGPVYAKLGRAIIYEIGDLDRWINAKKCGTALKPYID